MTAAFAGHRMIFEDLVKDKLFAAIEQAHNEGYTNFLVGTHGKFDALAANLCVALADKHKDVTVQLIVTSVTSANNYKQYCQLQKNVCTTIFDVEETHYKRRIGLSNKYMVDNCDMLICYVDLCRFNSGAAATLSYATKVGKTIRNIF